MKSSGGNALVMIVVMMLITFIFSSAAAHTAHMQMLATGAYVVNANGRRLAEGGVYEGAAYLNDILRAKSRAASESAYGRILSMEAAGLDIKYEDNGVFYLQVPDAGLPMDLRQELQDRLGEKNVLFKTIYKKYMDDEVRLFLESAAGAGGAFEYVYSLNLNDIHESEYQITVEIRYADGGFDISATTVNLKTGVMNAASGRVLFSFADGAETMSADNTLTIENAGSFGYGLVSAKKAFE